MRYIDNWEETKQRFEAWWSRSGTDRPLMRISALREDYQKTSINMPKYETPEEYHLDVDGKVNLSLEYYRSHKFYAEAFPNFDMNLGAGSMALYLGCKPGFAWDTIWFKECVKGSWREYGPLKYDPENYWWNKHLRMMKKAKTLLDGVPICIPDIVENVDILSALRGPQEFCYDLADEPETVKGYLNQLDELYFKYYDTMHEIAALEDGSSAYTVFQVWGPGKTAKVQCDFCAMMSPSQFKDLIVPSLKKQCGRLDNSIYHLDGPEAIKHLDALMGIDELDAIQWTPGAGKPDGGDEAWYPLYDKVINANKGLWIAVTDGTYDQWVGKARKLVSRYGAKNLYLLFGDMKEKEAEALINIAGKGWK